MGTNGHRRDSQTQLRREAAARRAALKQTASLLEDRLRERTDQIGEAFDRTRNQVEVLDDLIHRHRYLFIGGAIGVGFALTLGRRAKSPPALPPAGEGNGDGVRYVVVEPQDQRPGLLRSLAGGIAALALRQGATWLAHRVASSQEPDDDAPHDPSAARGRGRDSYVR
ncbi:MAG TPA: hypothetical protein VK698_25895 [Kofleriaceae bacterium]|nr:hypothetical protein [Kofleriaceae bacterium]